jgi:hypothetical protein
MRYLLFRSSFGVLACGKDFGSLALAGIFRLALIAFSFSTDASQLPARGGTGADLSVFQKIGMVYYVAPTGKDTNSGMSPSAALKTLSRAVELAGPQHDAEVGVEIVLMPGIYRESCHVLPRSSHSGAPLVIAAQTPGTAVIEGADNWNSGWTRRGDYYTHAWPDRWRHAISSDPDAPPEVVLRQEQVFINHQPLRQVLLADDLVPGTFYVSATGRLNKSSHRQGTISVCPPAGAAINTALVSRRGGLMVEQWPNIALRGLIVQHTTTGPTEVNGISVYNQIASFRGEAGSDRRGNILIEDCLVQWVVGAGFNVAQCANVTMRRCVGNDNGSTGLAGYEVVNGLFEDNEFSRNNFRGGWVGYDGWDRAGCKMLFMHHCSFLRERLVENQTLGLWLDTDCRNILIDGVTSIRNTVGIMFEQEQGITVSNSLISGNRQYGILASHVADLQVTGVKIFNSSGIQAGWGDEAAAWSYPTWDEVGLTTDSSTTVQPERGWRIYNSEIVGDHAENKIFYTLGAFPALQSTFRADNNRYWNPVASDNFHFFSARSKSLTFFTLPRWAAYFFRPVDRHSTFADPQYPDVEHDRFVSKINLALGKPASDSFGNLSAQLAVDGDPDGTLADGSTSVTESAEYRWWQVDLGSCFAIDHLTICHRTDTEQTRWKDYWIFVSERPFEAGDTPATLSSDSRTWKIHQTDYPNPNSDIPVNTSGRYIRISPNDPQSVLDLAEVQVFGIVQNVASGGIVSQSKDENQAWWQVDLGRLATIDSIQIREQTDQERLTDYWVFVSNAPFRSTDNPGTLMGRTGVWSSHQTSTHTDPMMALHLNNIAGRYVRVQLNRKNYLRLAEMKVFGCW